jgi:SAM-dependent methyltransferase
VIPVSASAGYQLWADTWDRTPSPIVAVEERALTPWIERCIKTGHPRIIDIGCGTGRWTTRLHAIGIDASPAMLAVAAQKPGLRSRLAVAEATALPVASQSADLVLSTLTLGHIRDHAAAMREFARILKPGGTLILTDFHPSAAAQGWRRTFQYDGRTYDLENHPYTLDQLRNAAPRLVLRETAEATIGEPERATFARAGKPELYAAACRIPAVVLSRWVLS